MSGTIDEKTKIPLFTALMVIVAMAGGIWWLSDLAHATAANAATLSNYQKDMRVLRKSILKIERKLKIDIDYEELVDRNDE